MHDSDSAVSAVMTNGSNDHTSIINLDASAGNPQWNDVLFEESAPPSEVMGPWRNRDGGTKPQ